MSDAFGISFSPNVQPGQQQALGSPRSNVGGRAQLSPVQTAIQTLSLRIPKTAGASAFAAPPLLTSAGGDALGNVNDAMTLERLRRMLFGDPMGGRFSTMPLPRSPEAPAAPLAPVEPTMPWTPPLWTPAPIPPYRTSSPPNPSYGPSELTTTTSAPVPMLPPRITPGALPPVPAPAPTYDPPSGDVTPAETSVSTVPLFYDYGNRDTLEI